MTKFLLSIHVLAAILAIGPIAIAASMFPRFGRQLAARTHPRETAHVPPGAEPPGAEEGTAALLHRICRVYAVVGIVVPVFGIATGKQLGVLTDAWLITSIILTVLAAALLGFVILPAQERLLDTGADSSPEKARLVAARLGMVTGVFNLLWAVVVVLMIVRPGSTTGV
ncbi:hypothetical protein [Streptomyces axinellae]|uniref:hypothetical protein n=1 Tax=Streptomyces axinellae TaxID=552788 RepID=UPI0031DFA480